MAKFSYSIFEVAAAIILTILGIVIFGNHFNRFICSILLVIKPSISIMLATYILCFTLGAFGFILAILYKKNITPGRANRLFYIGFAIILLEWVPIFSVPILLQFRSAMHANERLIIDECKTILEAQDFYYEITPPGKNSYAHSIGELFTNKLISEQLAKSDYISPQPDSSNGYFFIILKPLDDVYFSKDNSSFVTKVPSNNDLLERNFVLVAFPAAYNSSGINVYLADSRSGLFKADFGENTMHIIIQMTRSEPTNLMQYHWERIPP